MSIKSTKCQSCSKDLEFTGQFVVTGTGIVSDDGRFIINVLEGMRPIYITSKCCGHPLTTKDKKAVLAFVSGKKKKRVTRKMKV